MQLFRTGCSLNFYARRRAMDGSKSECVVSLAPLACRSQLFSGEFHQCGDRGPALYPNNFRVVHRLSDRPGSPQLLNAALQYRVASCLFDRRRRHPALIATAAHWSITFRRLHFITFSARLRKRSTFSTGSSYG